MSTSSTGWATSAGCPAPRSWCWTAWTRTPPATRSPSCWAGRRRHGWWSRSTNGRGATRTSASCLVRRGDLGSAELPDDLPDELSQALLDAWRSMSAPAREIARILAIAGRPTDLRTLAAMAAELGVSAGGVGPRGRRRRGGRARGGDGAWFRHPLLAGVLAESYLPGEAAPVHAAWARSPGVVLRRGCRRAAPAGRPRARTTSMPAKASAAFAALLQGADLAEKLGARREAADLLARAADLWEVAADATDAVGHAQLLERAGDACDWVGRSRKAIACTARHVTSSPPSDDPLWASRLTARGGERRLRPWREPWTTSTPGWSEPWSSPVSSRTAASTPKPWPSSPTPCGGTGRLDQARRVIDDAVAAAHRSGSAVGHQHGPWHPRQCLCWRPTSSRPTSTATVCWEHAMASGDPESIGAAYVIRLNVLHAEGDLRRLHEHARELLRVVGPVREQAVFPAALAEVLLDMGDLVTAEGIVRAGLAASGTATAEAMIRLHAGVLAARRGANDDGARVTWPAPTRSCPTSRSGQVAMAGCADGRGAAGRGRPEPGRSSSSSVCCP